MKKIIIIIITVFFAFISFSSELSHFKKGAELFRKHDYKHCLKELSYISDDYIAYDYVYYLKLKCLKIINSSEYECSLKKFTDYIEDDFPYYKELLYMLSDIYTEKGEYNKVFDIVKKSGDKYAIYFYSLQESISKKRYSDIAHYLDLLVNSKSIFCNRAILSSLCCYEKFLGHMDYITLYLKKLFTLDKESGKKVLKYMYNESFGFNNEYIMAYLAYLDNKPGDFIKYLDKYPHNNPFFEEVFGWGVSLFIKNNDKKLLGRLKILLDCDDIDIKTKAFSCFKISKKFIYDLDKKGFFWLKKAYGFFDRIGNKYYSDLSEYYLAMLCYKTGNRNGSLFYSYKAISSKLNEFDKSAAFYLRYRVLKKYFPNNAEEAKRELLHLYPDSVYSYMIKKDLDYRKYRKIIDTYSKSNISAKQKRKKYYHLYIAGFYNQAYSLIRKEKNSGKILKSFGKYNHLFRNNKYPVFYSELINKSSKENKINPSLILSVIREESRFDRFAKSWVGARGLMQFMPSTFKWLIKLRGKKDISSSDIYDPKVNIDFGAFYIDWLINYLHDVDYPLICAIAVYNGGIGNIRKWIKKYGEEDFVLFIPFDETKNYVRKIFKSFYNYEKKTNSTK